MRFTLPVLSACLLASPASAGGRTVIDGPVTVDVLRVTDGDTVLAEAAIWPGQNVRVLVRIRGIDAPEMNGKCRRERALARMAQRRLAELVAGQPITISNISGGKYYGRVLADLSTSAGVAAAPAMLGAGLARPYAGRKRQGWCE